MINIRCAPSHRGILLHALEGIHYPGWHHKAVWFADRMEDDLVLGQARYWRNAEERLLTEVKAIETVFTTCSLRDLQLVNSIALVQT